MQYTDGGQRYDSVQAFMFKPNGKFKYEVELNYTKSYIENDYTEPSDAAVIALIQSTIMGTSGIQSYKGDNEYWTIVVPDPPEGYPVMVIPFYWRIAKTMGLIPE